MEDFIDNKEDLYYCDAFISCLGSYDKGPDYFKIHPYNRIIQSVVEYDYPLAFAKMAKELNIKYFGLLSC